MKTNRRVMLLPAALVAALSTLAGCDSGSAPAAGDAAKVVDVRADSGDGTYSTGEALNIRVAFDKPVRVARGTPTLSLATRGRALDSLTAQTATAPLAQYTSGSGTRELLFTYVVQAADWAADLDYSATDSLAPAGATLVALDGTAVSVELPAPGTRGALARNADIRIINWQRREQVDADIFSADGDTVFSNTLGDRLTLKRVRVNNDLRHLRATRQSDVRETEATAVRIASGTGPDYLDHQAIVNADGSADIFWRVGTAVYSCRLAPTASACTPAVRLGTSPSDISRTAQSFFIGRDIGGRRHLLWISGETRMEEAFLDTATGNWTLRAGASGGGMLFDGRFSESDAGDVAFVWPNSANGHHLYALHYRAATGTWSAARRIEDEPGYADWPILAQDGAGNVSALWVQRISTPTSQSHVLVAQFDAATGTWSAPAYLTQTPVSPPDISRSISRHGNRIIVAWPQDNRLWTSTYDADSATWGAPRPFGPPLPATAGVLVALAANGDYSLVWTIPGETTSDIYAAYHNAARDSDSTGVRVHTLSSPGGGLRRAAVMTDGAFTADWYEPNARYVYELWQVSLQ